MASRTRTMIAGAAAVLVLGAAGAAGYIAGTVRSDPATIRLTLATCGLSPSPAPMELPLGALFGQGGAPGVALGPIRHSGLDAPLFVRFKPLPPETQPFARIEGETLLLGLDRNRLPQEIRLGCRHGAVARVEYRRGPLRLDLEVDGFSGTAPAAGQAGRS